MKILRYLLKYLDINYNYIALYHFQIKMELPTTKVNPWDVDTLDVYLHYCCPECDHKSKTKLLFVNHAFSCHPDAKGSSMSLPTNFSNQIYCSDLLILF